MGLTGQCHFVDDLCKTLPDDGSDYCPRHKFLVEMFGLEEARNVELGYECPGCSERHEKEQTKTCPICKKAHVCRWCFERCYCHEGPKEEL